MLRGSKKVNKLQFLKSKYSFFKEWLRTIVKSYYITSIEIDENFNTVKFKKIYKKMGRKIESKNYFIAHWEESDYDEENYLINVNVKSHIE